MTVFLHGDVLEKFKQIKDDSIDCIITSPPYFMVRDYGYEGSWGVEKNVNHYISRMRKFCSECLRVLKPSGSFWLNIADTYEDTSLLAVPEKIITSCLGMGFTLRNKIVWHKRNAMPTSVKNRFSNRYEMIYFFVKTKKYYFDLDQVREPRKTELKSFNVRVRDTEKSKFLQKATEKEKIKRQDGIIDPKTGMPKTNYRGFNNRYLKNLPKKGKNPGDVWDITVKPLKKWYHPAIFPQDLIEKILKCACPDDGIVLDPFMGSGTVAVVAKKMNKNFIGIEKNYEFVKIASQRVRDIENDKQKFNTVTRGVEDN